MNQDKQFVFSCETSMQEEKLNYNLTIPKDSFPKGSYSLNCIIYKPAIAQYDNINDCCTFSILNNKDEFAHLEGFNIGSVYKEYLWEY